MRGRPVWLASLSKCELGRPHRLKNTGTWSADETERVYRRLCWILRGCGDESKERYFRMNLTVCLHRAVTAEERAGLPERWHADGGALAGGPVELFWVKGVPSSDSCLPCHDPERFVVDPSRPDLWIPLDCGGCPPCLARIACERAAALEECARAR